MRTILVLSLSLAMFAMDAADRCAQAQDTLVFQLQGTVYDKEYSVPIAGAIIEVVGTDGSRFTALCDDKGSFSFAANGQKRFINANTSYTIRITTKDRLSVNDQICTVGLTESTTFAKEYYLTRVKEFIDVPPPVINFDHRSARLDPEAQTAADIIVTMLNDNPTIVFELRGHCSTDEDTALAVKRGEAVMRYLIKKGIDAQRLGVRGFGAREPSWAATDMNGLNQVEREQAMATKRRVDFAVVSFDYHK